MWLWYLDRGSGLAAYVLLWLAVFTGIFHVARRLGPLQRAAKIVHVPASVLASAALLVHVAVGLVDASLVFRGSVPHPAYSDAYFLAGLLTGSASLLLIVTSVAAFVDARRFQRPWDPKLVHAFSYGGFAFAGIHAAAVGSDPGSFGWPAVIALSGLLLFALVVRVLGEPVSTRPTGPAADPPGDR